MQQEQQKTDDCWSWTKAFEIFHNKKNGRKIKHLCQNVHIHGSIVLKVVIFEGHILMIYLFQ